VARPTLFDAKLAQQICDHVRAGNYLSVAAKAAGIGRSTLYEWVARSEAGAKGYEGFADALKQAEAAAECASVATVRAGTQGWQANAWYLERKYPDRWASDRRKKKAETELAKARLTEHAHLEDLLRETPVEELRAIIARLRGDKPGG
jgi:transposase